MKLASILSALGGSAAPLINTASSLAIALGAIYLVDCRLTARSPESVDRCYFTALPLMGVGAAGRGGFSVGYQTFNPALHREDHGEPTTERDSSGRFTKKR
jgi:hypothetical protein